MKDIIKRKMKYYAGHVPQARESHLQLIEGKVQSKRKVGGPRRTLMKDICEWKSMDTYEKVKRAADVKKLKIHICQPSIRSRQINECIHSPDFDVRFDVPIFTTSFLFISAPYLYN
jgi:hypothetical protein